jgi:GTPase
VKIAQIAITEGRAIVIVLNKIDCLKTHRERNEARESLKDQMRSSLHQIQGVEVVEMSAREWSEGLTQSAKLYGAIQRARTRWERRIPTSALTRYVTRFNETVAIGMSGAKRGRRGATRFISQKKTRPPMFRLDGSSAVSDNYIQSLTNGIRNEFGLEGVPIRIKRPSRRMRR